MKDIDYKEVSLTAVSAVLGIAVYDNIIKPLIEGEEKVKAKDEATYVIEKSQLEAMLFMERISAREKLLQSMEKKR
tara:strand:+ start:196 stop:423 length:228 start_codon:yes stop_codon:yes gene_type:complete